MNMGSPEMMVPVLFIARVDMVDHLHREMEDAVSLVEGLYERVHAMH